MANKKLSFAQFGEGFVLMAFTPKVIGTTIDAALKAKGTMTEHMKKGPAEVNARIRAQGCRVKRVNSVELAIFIPLKMDMDVRIAAVVPEKYKVDAVVEVRFVIELRRPLTAFVGMRAIPLSAVSVTVQGLSWTKIAEQIGKLADEVRTAIAKGVQDAFNTPEVLRSRTVDVMAAIHDKHKQMLAGGLADAMVDAAVAVGSDDDADIETLPEAWAEFVDFSAYDEIAE